MLDASSGLSASWDPRVSHCHMLNCKDDEVRCLALGILKYFLDKITYDEINIPTLLF